MSTTRITADLGDPKLLKLLKLEAQENETTIKEVLIKALESYFFHRIENNALEKCVNRLLTYGKSQSLVTIAIITSKIDGLKLKGDVRLQQWESASLLDPSIVRMSKVATIESDIIINNKFGQLFEKTST
jgi:hypothetical protein